MILLPGNPTVRKGRRPREGLREEMRTSPGALCSQGCTTAARLTCRGARRARADLRWSAPEAP